MYEIWLMLNIVWEIALDLWPTLLVVAVLWLALTGLAWRKAGSNWRAGLLPALGIGAVTAIVAALVLPGWTLSTLSEVAYWVDWVILLGLAAAAGAVAVALAWPVLAWRQGRVQV